MKGLGVNLLYAVMLVAVLCVAVPAASGIYDAVREQGIADAMLTLADSGYTVYASDGDLTVSGAVNADSINAPTGRTATYVIAASDAPDHVKAQADYVCDGTDDQVEIQAAIDSFVTNTSGGLVHLSAGEFTISSTIKLWGAVSLVGESIAGGANGTRITLADNSDCDMIELDMRDGSAHDYFSRIEHLTLGGNSANQASGHGVSSYDLHSDAYINHIFVHDVKQDAIHFESGYYMRILNSWLEGAGGYSVNTEVECWIQNNVIHEGIYGDSSYLMIQGNKFKQNTSHDIEITGGTVLQTTITGNRFQSGTGSGHNVYLHGTSGNNIVSSVIGDNQFYSAALDNIYAEYVSKFSIAGNVFSDADSNNIYISQSAYGTITGNEMYGAAEEGIYLSNVNKTTVSGNQISGCLIGIRLDLSTGNSINGNRISNLKRHGIQVVSSPSCTISGNVITNINSDGGSYDTINMNSSVGTVITGNYLDGSPARYTIYNSGSHTLLITSNKMSVGATGYYGTNKTITNTLVRNNIGYIDPSEVRTASVPYVAGNVGAIAASWHNPEAQDIYITKIVVKDANDATLAATAAIGIADDAAGTNLGAEFFTAIPLNAATGTVFDSYVAGDTGAQTKWIALQDSASATDGWLNMQIAAQNSDGTGTIYITYCGQ